MSAALKRPALEVEGCKVNATKGNRMAAANNQPAKTDNQSTHDLAFATCERQRKDESSLIARLALAGHVVHRGNCNDYTVHKWGLSYYAQDLAELSVLAIRLGVRNA